MDGTVILWDVEQGKPIGAPLNGQYGRLYSVAYNSDGKILASASEDGTVILWDVDQRKPIRAPLKGHQSPVSNVAFSADGKILFSLARDGTILLWEVETGKEVFRLANNQKQGPIVSMSPDGKILAAGSKDQTVWLWNVASGKQLETIGGKAFEVVDFEFSPDGASLAIAGSDGSIKIWRISIGEKSVPRGLDITGQEGIWVVGDRGFVARSQDAGRSWSEIAPPGESDLYAVFAAGTEKAWVAGSNGAIWFTEDGGANWKNQSIKDGETIRALAFLDDAVSGWAVGDGGVIYSTRNSQSWQLLKKIANAQLKAIHVQANKMAWIAAEVNGSRTVFQANQAGDPDSWRLLQQDRLPAPWWFIAGVPAILLLSFLTVRTWRQVPTPPPASIAAQALSDRPIGWRDADPLNFRPIALSLSRFIRNINTEPPLTLAVTGRWGTGKSSLMNLLQHDLRQYGAFPVWFNAWHHRKEEHLLAALLENIRSQAIPPWWSWPGVTFRARLFWLRTRKQLSWILATGTFTMLFVYVIHLALPDIDYQHLAAILKKSIDIFDKLPQSVKTGIDWGKYGITGVAATMWLRSKLIALTVDPAKLLGQLSSRTRIRDFRDKLSLRYRFGKEFGEVCRALRTRRTPGLTILIDDLDRCRPRDVLEVLEAVNFFVSVGSCFVILGMDKGQVEHCIGLGFKDVVESLPDEHFVHTYGVMPKTNLEKQYLNERGQIF